MVSGIELHGDPSYLSQAVRNLLSHSLERSPAGGGVALELEKHADQSWSLRVRDSGRDLSDIELRALNAVRRFRGDEGRGAELRGDIGLPMAVVHEVCHQFGLTLKFSRAAGGGLDATISGVSKS